MTGARQILCRFSLQAISGKPEGWKLPGWQSYDD